MKTSRAEAKLLGISKPRKPNCAVVARIAVSNLGTTHRYENDGIGLCDKPCQLWASRRPFAKLIPLSRCFLIVQRPISSEIHFSGGKC
jgi:hypothetical protein